jgi:protein-disulfide isomerase
MLPPGELGFRLGSKMAQSSLDVFIDIACPFSKKIFLRLLDVHVWAEGCRPGALSVRFLVTPQPWHPQSSILAEAVLAVQAIDAKQTVPFLAG